MLDRASEILERFEEIEGLLAQPEIASDYAHMQKLLKEHGSLKAWASVAAELRQVNKEIAEAKTIIQAEEDKELAAMAKEELGELEERKTKLEDELRIALVPRDPNDDKNVIVEIRAGTGGDEAGLFAADLFRMYARYAQRMGWKAEMIDNNESGIGSIKEVVFLIKGDGAFSKLKHESGVHRVQRVPATETSGRIHTSAATVAVLPEAEEVDVDISAEDLEIDVFHAGGHGGQNVQKVATAIRITHKPTGIVAICQDERSQLKNKEKAMAVLRARVLARKIEEQQQEISQERRSQIGTGDRSERVRTYNFPQNRVTDHRVDMTSHSLPAVLEGDIDAFVEALMAEERRTRLQEAGL
ncbi:MAG: peptide chain release factor 1 [Chloroflexi bacterium]|nr:peptide chain release factor 1 [Chloroflexota bacterium]